MPVHEVTSQPWTQCGGVSQMQQADVGAACGVLAELLTQPQPALGVDGGLLGNRTTGHPNCR